jgi:hypothetical protein
MMETERRTRKKRNTVDKEEKKGTRKANEEVLKHFLDMNTDERISLIPLRFDLYIYICIY